MLKKFRVTIGRDTHGDFDVTLYGPCSPSRMKYDVENGNFEDIILEHFQLEKGDIAEIDIEYCEKVIELSGVFYD